MAMPKISPENFDSTVFSFFNLRLDLQLCT